MLTTIRRFVPTLLLTLACAVAQEPRALTHDDYDQWKSLRGVVHRRDAAWIAYQIEPQVGDGVLEIREVEGERCYRVPMGTGARFCSDQQHVVFTIAPSKVAEREKKIDELRKKAKKAAAGAAEEEGGEKGGEAGEPRRGREAGARRGGAAAPAAGDAADATKERSELAILDLRTGAIEKLGKVKGFTLPEELPVLLFHREKPEPAKKPKAEGEGEPTPVAEAKETEAVKAPAVATGSEKPAEAKPAAPKKKVDPLEKKRAEGTELVIRDLSTGVDRTIADVAAYGTSRKGAFAWYHTSAKTPAPDTKYGVFVVPLRGGEPTLVLDGILHVANAQFDRDERAFAFTSDRDDFAADKPRSDLWLWDVGAASAVRIVGPDTPGLPAGMRTSGDLTFSRDGSVLAFSVQDAPEPDALPILPEDKVVLDLWNWRDGQLQTQQQKRTGNERNPERTAVWHRDQHRLQMLGDDRLRTMRFVGPDGAWMLATDGRAYEEEVSWDGRYVDVWLVNSLDGARQRVLEKLRGNVTTSPGGRYLVWFGADYHWWSHDVLTGARRDLTANLAVPFHQTDDDHPEPDSPHGLGGWTDGDRAVLLYDEFDVWKVTLATGDAVCVTDGFGRGNRLRLRVQSLPRDPDQQYVDDELLLASTRIDTMAEGFFADSLDRVQKPRKLFEADCNLAALERPRDSDRLFFTKSTFRTFPDLWTAAGDFTGARRLTDANPQQKDYRWGTSRLVHWIDGDGNRCNGVLIEPDGFDPKKKYPLMVNFYERMTQGLHNYVAPAPGTSPNASYYVSNGYLWFMPDVHYEIGYPGASCVKCVVSGVQHLIAQGFVDEKGIGAAGHSWGGYQTAFLVTQTNIFAAVESGAPVCNMLSAYGGIRYETGMSRQFQYEKTQSRIGGTPWQYPIRYQINSPIWYADKVQTPVLIMANDQDGAVPWTQGIEYFTALRRLGKECYLFNYNGEAHGLRQRQNMKDWTRRMSEYFAHHLKKAPAPKWMTDGVPFQDREREKLPFAQSYIDAHLKPAPVAAKTEAVADAANPKVAPVDGVSVAAGTTKDRDAAKAVDASTSTSAKATGATLVRGATAPDFAIADETGHVHRLADHRGRLLLVWFYPRASTPGCTTQGCGLRDAFAEFSSRGVDVLGVSVDDAKANAAFRSEHAFPFPLLCDTDRTMCIAYGAAADEHARAAKRIAVLIDGRGKVVRIWTKVDPKTFAADALAALPL